jgi:Domain of unknown function (DUF1992)
MFDLIAEQKIAEAIARGELDNLKNAGYVPPELETLNEIAQLERVAMGNATALEKLALLKAKMEKLSACRSSRTRRSPFSGRCTRCS